MAFFNDLTLKSLAINNIFSKLEVSNLLNQLAMKNIKRLVILIVLIFCASKVLFSDFEISKSENNVTILASK